MTLERIMFYQAKHNYSEMFEVPPLAHIEPKQKTDWRLVRCGQYK